MVGGFVPGLGRAGSPHARAPFQVLLSLAKKKGGGSRGAEGSGCKSPPSAPTPGLCLSQSGSKGCPFCSSPQDIRAAAGLGCSSAAEGEL